MRYIKPEIIIKNRFKDANYPKFDLAILIFRDSITSKIIRDILKCKCLNQKIIYGINPENTYFIEYSNKKILVIDQCLWGGPQVSIIIEELAFLSIKTVIGIGASGSLTSKLEKGKIVFNQKSILNDGTSKFYSNKKKSNINKDIFNKLKYFLDENNIYGATSGTIDAIYQETYKFISNLKKMGAEIINMETGPFYAASEFYNINSIWIGCVSDCLYKNNWKDWFDKGKMTEETGLLTKQILEIL